MQNTHHIATKLDMSAFSSQSIQFLNLVPFTQFQTPLTLLVWTGLYKTGQYYILVEQIIDFLINNW